MFSVQNKINDVGESGCHELYNLILFPDSLIHSFLLTCFLLIGDMYMMMCQATWLTPVHLLFVHIHHYP